MSDQFPEHVAGTPYELTREQFAHFAGIAPGVAVISQGLTADAEARYQPLPEPAVAFWAAIAAFEASRRFNPLASRCGSELIADTDDGTMVWRYWSTSGTLMEAIEARECSTIPAPGYPGVECGELPRPVFLVTIPAERDQPGRYHWKQLRNGGTYCD